MVQVKAIIDGTVAVIPWDQFERILVLRMGPGNPIDVIDMGPDVK